jgi:hypothetical protein
LAAAKVRVLLVLVPAFLETAFPEAATGDFFRVFLDIRLPFVAFSGAFRE